MNPFKRAILYLTRKRGRTAILLIVFVVMAVFSMVCLSINRAAGNELNKLSETMSSSFTVEMDMDTVLNIGPPPPEDLHYLTPEVIEQIETTEGVSAYYTQHNNHDIWVDIELKYGIYHDLIKTPLDDDDIDTYKLWAQTLLTNSFYGCSQSNMHEFFRTGAFELVEGRHIQPDDKNKALISREVANRNGLKLGDTFNVRVLALQNDEYSLYGSLSLEIIGIYQINFNQDANVADGENGNVLLTEYEYAESAMFSDMYTSDFLEQIYNCALSGGYNDMPHEALPDYLNTDVSFEFVTVFINSPENIDLIINEVKQLSFYNEDYYNVSIDTDAYEASAKPLRQIQTVMIVLIIVSVIACVIIIWLVSSMWAKSRKKEMGILLALGNSRRKVLLQFFIELLIICIIALVIGTIVSAAILGPVGNAANAAVAPDPNADRFTYEFDAQYNLHFSVNIGEPVDLTYYLTALPVVITAGIMICASLISVAASSLRTMKLKPKDIFSKW